jgi:hypothetical protein
MDKSSIPTLPHGADGIELGDLVIEFRADKVIALRRNVEEHFTLHAGNNSGVIDIHRTRKDAQGCEQHATIFAMRRDNILPFLNELSSLIPNFLQLFRRLNLRSIEDQQIEIVRGVLPIEQEHIGRVTRRKPGRRRLVLDPQKLRDEIYAAEYLEEVWDWPSEPFSLWKNGRMIGIAFKASDPHDTAKLSWIRLRDLARFYSEMQHLVEQVALRYAIPPSEYHNYPDAELRSNSVL